MKKYTISWWKDHLKTTKNRKKHFEHLEKVMKVYKKSGNAATHICKKNVIANKVGILNDIPYAIKDNISTKGIETYGGSNILRGYIPPFNATVVDLLEKNGAHLLLKTILDELGMAGTGLSSATNKLYSPWNPKRIIGGSSSGSCFSVTTGMVPFAIGTDTGDSVRRPAALNGIIGFKPSWGTVSRYGVFPYAPSLDTIAWFTNCVDDCKTILDILNVPDKKDISMNHVMLNKKTPESIRIGIDKSLFERVKNEEMAKKYRSLLNIIEKKGNMKLVNISIEKNLLNLAWSIYVVISFTEALSSNFNLGGLHFGNQNLGTSFASIVHNNRGKGFGDTVKKRFSLAALILDKGNQGDIYKKAKKCRKMVQEMMDRIFQKVDLIIYPASDNIVPFIKNISSSEIQKEANWVVDYAVFANLNGHPSLTLPIDYANDEGEKLPFSIALDAKHGKEYTLLKFAKKIESIVGFTNHLHEKTNV